MDTAVRRAAKFEVMQEAGGSEEEGLSEGRASSGDYGLSDGGAPSGSEEQSGHDEEEGSSGGSERAGAEEGEVSGGSGASGPSSEGAEEGVPRKKGRGDAKEPNQASAFARAFEKVVGSSQRGPTGRDPILAASKSVIKRQREEEEEQQSKREAKKLRSEMRKRGHKAVLPKGQEPEVDAREKTLMRIATRGVVRLFNAVAKAQKEAETAALRGAKPHQAVKASTSAFLAELKGTSAQTKVGGAGPRPAAQQGGGPGPVGGSNSSWAVLQEGFAGLEGGSKLKDWDKPPGEDDVVPEGEVLEGFSDSEGFEDGAW